MNGPEAVQNECPFSADFQDEETLSAQQSTTQALHFAFDDNCVGAREEAVFLHHVLVHPVKFQDDNLAGHSRSQQHLAGTAASAQRLEEELLPCQELSRQGSEKTAFHLAFNIDGRGTSYHRTRLGFDVLTSRQFHPHHGKCPWI